MRKLIINEATTFDGCQPIVKTDVAIELTTYKKLTIVEALKMAIAKLSYELEREKEREAKNEQRRH